MLLMYIQLVNECLVKPYLCSEGFLLYTQCMAETLDRVFVMGVF